MTNNLRYRKKNQKPQGERDDISNRTIKCSQINDGMFHYKLFRVNDIVTISSCNSFYIYKFQFSYNTSTLPKITDLLISQSCMYPNGLIRDYNKIIIILSLMFHYPFYLHNNNTKTKSGFVKLK